MKVLLTGITGNLGFEIAHSFLQRGIEIVPIVRNMTALGKLHVAVSSAIEMDLTAELVKIPSADIDCIVHSAGNVHFEKSGDSNSKMMQSVLQIAKACGVPMYYVSTAFLWRERENLEQLRNAYERDKFVAENILRESSVPHTIFRPSVLVGNSRTGQLSNWSGYYMLVAKFLEAVKVSNDMRIRFPKLTGTSDMVPVDHAANVIADVVAHHVLDKQIFVTNPEPPEAQWVLDTTLNFFGIEDMFEFLDITFSDYEKLDKSEAEELLYSVGTHFSPYWSLSYNFPNSALNKNVITEAYIQRTLHSFQEFSNKCAV